MQIRPQRPGRRLTTVTGLSVGLTGELFGRTRQLALALREQNVDPNEVRKLNQYLCYLFRRGKLCGNQTEQGGYVVTRAVSYLQKLLAAPRPFGRSSRTAAYWQSIINVLDRWPPPTACQEALLCMLYAERLLQALTRNRALVSQLGDS
jgi:hypothetical protein